MNAPRQQVHTPASEWHWHRVTPDRFLTHLAMWEAAVDGAEAEWGDHVTDEEYRGAREALA